MKGSSERPSRQGAPVGTSLLTNHFNSMGVAVPQGMTGLLFAPQYLRELVPPKDIIASPKPRSCWQLFCNLSLSSLLLFLPILVINKERFL